MVAALSENFLDPIFLAKVAFANKLDVAAVFRRQPLGILPQPVAQRLGEPRVVENADVALVQVRGHARTLRTACRAFSIRGPTYLLTECWQTLRSTAWSAG